MPVSVFAPAKVNLFLHVGAPRADGRHPLTSVAVFADVGDELWLAPGHMQLRVRGPFADSLLGDARAGTNLVTQALEALGVAADVTLEKRLPIASGIGGGSADAAAAMRAANAVFGLRLTDEMLEARAAALGADAPVCVRCRPAFMTGGGEVLAPAIVPSLHAVLVNPGVAMATAAVYRRFDEMGAGRLLGAQAPPRWDRPEQAILALGALRNDLEAPACSLAPEIGAALARLREDRFTRLARMSGSGSTCFALVDDADAAATLARALGRERPTWWVRATTLGAIDAAPRAL